MGCFPGRNSKKGIKYTENITNKGLDKEEFKIEAGVFVGKRQGAMRDVYTLGPSLGSGHYGVVRIGTHKITGQKRAIKIIQKEKISMNTEERSSFLNEIEVLSQVDHPNIVKLYEFYEDEGFYYIITEYITGGELFEFLIKRHTLSEPIAAHFMKQLISGVAHCHSNNIVHRDLKPEHLLLDKESPEALLKIIDFGTSKKYDGSSKLTKKYGTSYYIAPEVLLNSYTEKCDI